MIRAALAANSAVEFARTAYLPSRLGITPAAAANVLRVARQFDEFCGAHIGDLSDEIVTAFLQSRVAAGDRPATVNGARSKILALWRCAWRKGVLDQLPRDVPRMREPSDPPRARRTEELMRLLNHCLTLSGTIGDSRRSDWWLSLFLGVAATAERPGAIVQTLTEDCDLDAATIRVWSSTTKQRRGRVYSLAGWAVLAIARIYRPGRRLLWDWPHCRRHLYTCARRIMEDAGLRPSRETNDLFYSIRRWNLSYLAAESLQLAQQQSGHASAATLVRHYVDPQIATNRRAVEALPVLTLSQPDRQMRLFD